MNSIWNKNWRKKWDLDCSLHWWYGLFSSYHKGTAMRIRGDHGTENSTVAALQNIFRAEGTDNFAGERSFQYGKSIANQVFFSCFFKLCHSYNIFYKGLRIIRLLMNTSKILFKKRRRMYPGILKKRFSIPSSPVTIIFNFYSKIYCRKSN